MNKEELQKQLALKEDVRTKLEIGLYQLMGQITLLREQIEAMDKPKDVTEDK